MSDSNGYIHDPDGIKLDIIKDIKLVKRGRIKEYAAQVPGSDLYRGLPRHLDHPLRHCSALRHSE